MKQTIILTGVLILLAFVASADGRDDYKRAIRNGAKAKLTLKVIDETGAPVSNAVCKVGFLDVATTIDETRGLSNNDGFLVAEGKAKHFIGGTINKEGYYQSLFEFKKGNPKDPYDYASKVKDGRWLPWNPTIPVVLKKIRDPVDMIVEGATIRIPQFDVPLGFDLERHDWVAPEGEGKVADMVVRFDIINETSPYRKLIVEFPGEKNGAYLRKKDMFSLLKSDYHAMTNAIYESRIENGGGKHRPAYILLGGDDYLVFRIRSKTDETGNMISAMYGKIYGPFDYAVESRYRMRMISFFNPVENDTNLEFNGKGHGDGTLFGR